MRDEEALFLSMIQIPAFGWGYEKRMCQLNSINQMGSDRRRRLTHPSQPLLVPLISS